MNDRVGEGRFAACLETKLSKRRVSQLFAALGWTVRRCAWSDFEVIGPSAGLVIEAEAPILLHGWVADPESAVDAILETLRRAGVGFAGEWYDAGGHLAGEFRSTGGTGPGTMR